jgi:transposase-like protein
MSEYVPCPKCGSTNVQKVNYTMWGGMIGPRLLKHVKCQDCKATFNGKTGKSNSGAIALYLAVTFLIVFAIFFLATMARG